MLRFLFSHPRMLAFGVLMTLFSSFGQTFLISIFVPQILDAFALGTASFGLLYAAATLTSAFCLPFFGRLLDRVSLPGFSLAAGGGLAVACLGMAVAPNLPVLFLSIVGLRLTGQGLLSLAASTAMARTFGDARGKALSISSLGYPLGEGLLPLAVVLLIHAVGWRLGWGILGATILCVLLPATRSLVGRETAAAGTAGSAADIAAPRASLLRDPTFHLLLPVSLFLPFVLTALFLYQIPLAESRGWDTRTMASAFVGFAVARLAVSLAIGPLIDQWSAIRIFPHLLVPSSLGLGALLVLDTPWLPYAYLVLAGLSLGMAGPVMTAVLAEVYGIESLGSIKSTMATFGVLATALGPMTFGILLDAGAPYTTLLHACLLLAVACTATGWLACRRIAAGDARPGRRPD